MASKSKEKMLKNKLDVNKLGLKMAQANERAIMSPKTYKEAPKTQGINSIGSIGSIGTPGSLTSHHFGKKIAKKIK